MDNKGNNNDKYGQTTPYKQQLPPNPNPNATSPTSRWRVDVNCEAFVRHARRCQWHGEEYKKALNEQNKKWSEVDESNRLTSIFSVGDVLSDESFFSKIIFVQIQLFFSLILCSSSLVQIIKFICKFLPKNVRLRFFIWIENFIDFSATLKYVSEPIRKVEQKKCQNLPNGLEKSKFIIALGFKNSVSCLYHTRMTGVSWIMIGIFWTSASIGYRLKSVGMNGFVFGNDNFELSPQFDHSCE